MNQAAALIIVMAIVTIAIRFAPFVIFSKGSPVALKYLGDVLPYSVMAMLVVYCLKGVNVLSGSHGIPEIIAITCVIGLHKLKHNTLLSIVAGTVVYMILVQLVFTGV